MLGLTDSAETPAVRGEPKDYESLRHHCAGGRAPLFTPETMRKTIASAKRFTSKADMEVVGEMFDGFVCTVAPDVVFWSSAIWPGRMRSALRC